MTIYAGSLRWRHLQPSARPCAAASDALQVFKQAKVKAGKAVSVSSKASASGV